MEILELFICCVFEFVIISLELIFLYLNLNIFLLWVIFTDHKSTKNYKKYCNDYDIQYTWNIQESAQIEFQWIVFPNQNIILMA